MLVSHVAALNTWFDLIRFDIYELQNSTLVAKYVVT